MSSAVVARIADSAWFNQTFAPYLVLDTHLQIRAVNLAYELATGHTQDWLLGEDMFEAFPDNPDDPSADGVAKLSRSLEAVLRTGYRQWMAYQRYDVRDPDEPEVFAYRVWAPVNVPIKEGGVVVAVLHHVQDVTVILREAGEPVADTHSRADLDSTIESLLLQFPDVPRGTILGLLTDSERVVLRTLGVPDAAQAKDLARMRIELRTGQRARPEGELPL